MGNESHVRIDEGVRRGPRKPPRKNIDRTPKAAKSGMFVSPYTQEQRIEVTKQAIELLAKGFTTCEIGEKFNVPGSTVRYWLLNDEKAEHARRSMINQELARTGEEIRSSTDPLSLARAREEARYWMWIAERRESRLYGQRLAVENTQKFDPQSAELLTSAKELLGLFKSRQEKVINPVQNAALQDNSGTSPQIQEKPLESVEPTVLADA